MTMPLTLWTPATADIREKPCANPERDHPMSFATGAGGNCPHQDLNIANGAYSCGDVYILRNGVKSTEIAINQVNEFHADVSNPFQRACGAPTYSSPPAEGRLQRS